MGQEPLGSVPQESDQNSPDIRTPIPAEPGLRLGGQDLWLVDSIEATTELGIATFLTQNGIPVDVAIEITWWFVTFA